VFFIGVGSVAEDRKLIGVQQSGSDQYLAARSEWIGSRKCRPHWNRLGVDLVCSSLRSLFPSLLPVDALECSPQFVNGFERPRVGAAGRVRGKAKVRDVTTFRGMRPGLGLMAGTTRSAKKPLLRPIHLPLRRFTVAMFPSDVRRQKILPATTRGSGISAQKRLHHQQILRDQSASLWRSPARCLLATRNLMRQLNLEPATELARKSRATSARSLLVIPFASKRIDFF